MPDELQRALLGLLPLALLARALGGRRWRAGQRHGRLWSALAAAAPALLVIALAGPELHSGSSRPTVLSVDQSASIGAGARAIERRWIARAGEDGCVSPCSIIRFAGATAVGSPSSSPGGDLQAGASDLQSAIGAAVGLAPRGGRVAVLSDGGQTRGELLDVAPLARRRGVQVDWVALDGEQLPDASVTAINAPGVVHLGDTVPLSLTLHSNVAAPATLTVSAGGARAVSQRIELHTGDNPLLLLYTAASRGWQSFRATVALAGDVQPANNSLSAVTDVLAEPRVLIAGDSTATAAGLLARQGLDVAATVPAGLPHSAAGYAGEDSVVLDDIPARELAQGQIAALEQAVREQGLGLIVLGGQHSFSLGGYAHSSLQQLLPVTSLVPGNLQRRNLAVELVLDHSGSMSEPAGGVEKIAMARAAARQSAAFLQAHQDALGIVDFDITAHTLVALQLLTSAADERRVDRIVDGLQADGGTNIYLGLKAGLERLLASTAKQRHMILLTDGISQPANYKPLLAEFRRAHISVATVALGAEADRSLLSEIAAGTGGRAYVTEKASELPRIFVKETQLSAKPVRITGRLSVALAADSPVVRSLLGKPLPPLAGNVVVQLKNGAQADLLASEGSQSDPALSEWQIGSGRVVAWTPGLDSDWAGQWVAQSRLWNDAVRWVDRGVETPPLTPQSTGAAAGTLQIDLAGAGTAAFGVSEIDGRLSGPASRAVSFRPVGPSLYEADPGPLPEGVYRFTVHSLGSVRQSAQGEIAIGYPAEYSPVTAYVSPMAQLARQTGGRILAAEDYAGLRASSHSLRRALALAALLAFLIGVAGRMLSGSDAGRPGGRGPARPSPQAELQASG